jgi:aspartate kinase
MDWIIVKLGGTSQCLRGYEKVIAHCKDNTKRYIFVVSAISGVTNMLEKFVLTKDIKIIDNILKIHYDMLTSLSLKEHCIKPIKEYLLESVKKYCSDGKIDSIYDQAGIIGCGEYFSSAILTEFLESKSFNAKFINATSIIQSTKEIFKLYPTTRFVGRRDIFDRITENGFPHDVIYVTQGFVGSTPSGKIVLLGRGGSDTSGAIIANMMNAKEYIVYTDVDGVFTSDPRICPDAKNIPKIDYKLIQEVASMGAKVMHPASIIPCMEKSIPIYVTNTFSDSGLKTVITDVSKDEYSTAIVALQKGITLFKISSVYMADNSGFMYDIFRRFSEKKISVGIVNTSEFTINTTTDEKSVTNLAEVLEELREKYEVEVIENCSIVSIVTNKIPEIYKSIRFSDIEHHILHIAGTNNTISFVVDGNRSNEVVKKLHSFVY